MNFYESLAGLVEAGFGHRSHFLWNLETVTFLLAINLLLRSDAGLKPPAKVHLMRPAPGGDLIVNPCIVNPCGSLATANVAGASKVSGG